MKKFVVVVCVVLVAALSLNVAQVMAGPRHHGGHHYRGHHGGGGIAPFVVGGILGALATGAIIAANQPPQGFVPCVRSALVQCNRCGRVFGWQGMGNPAPPPCGCPSSYRVEWQ